MFNPLTSLTFLKSKVLLFALYTALVFSAGYYVQSGKQAKKEVKLHNKALVAHEKQLTKDEGIIKEAIDELTELTKLKESANEEIHTINSRRVFDSKFTSLYNKAVKSANAHKTARATK